MKNKSKFRAKQLVAIRGYEAGDPRQLAYVVRQSENFQFICNVQVGDSCTQMVYAEGELRPLTSREIGPRKGKRDARK